MIQLTFFFFFFISFHFTVYSDLPAVLIGSDRVGDCNSAIAW